MTDLAHELDKLRQQNLYRSRQELSSSQQVEPVINGQKVLSFCSNDYLGLANHPKVVESYVTAAKNVGVGSGASHLITGHHQSHAKLEKELADFLGCEKVLLFSTGYMANLGVVSALTNRSSTIFADKLNHASLNDAAILSRAKLKRYFHQDISLLEKSIAETQSKNNIILSDGVFSMDGTVAPIKELQSLASGSNTRMVIDDAHGIGVLGEYGKGCTEGLITNQDVLIGTLGKAFGTFGAFVAANQQTIEWIIQKAHSYIYTTALPPSIAEATRTSLKIIKEEKWRRDHLQTLIIEFQTHCKKIGLNLIESNTPIQPIIVGSSKKVLAISAHLLKAGIMVPAIRPPTVPNHTARLRFSFSANHSKDQLNHLIVVLEQSLQLFN